MAFLLLSCGGGSSGDADGGEASLPGAETGPAGAVFPGAEGFGVDTAAGSGRNSSPPEAAVVHVTSPDDTGDGSLRACIEAPGPRTCVFDFAGAIKLNSALRVTEPYLTVAGESAPSPGVTITRAGFRIETHDVLIRHLAIRVGDSKKGPSPAQRDGVTIGSDDVPGSRVVLDHLSISWAVDENVDVWNGSDVTISNCIIAEGLENSIHPKGRHSKGVLIGDRARRVSVHHSLLAHNVERNPYLKPGATGEFLNNVVYDWGSAGGWNAANLSDVDRSGRAVMLNFEGNFYRAGRHSFTGPMLYADPLAGGTRVFASHNIGPTRPVDSGDEWSIASLPRSAAASAPLSPRSSVQAMSPSATWDYVLAHAGARPTERDDIDARIVSEVRSGSGDIKDCLSGCGRAAGSLPSEKPAGSPPELPADPLFSSGDSYTSLEAWLHARARSLE